VRYEHASVKVQILNNAKENFATQLFVRHIGAILSTSTIKTTAHMMTAARVALGMK
jgi:hypothetical protein